jgi:Carboxypeptidase regulatory-like domain
MMVSTRLLAVILLLTLAACGGESDSGAPALPTSPTTPTTPSPPPTPPAPTPSTKYALSGIISETGTPNALPDARVQVLDGPSQGRSVTADAEGRYRIDELDPGTFAVRATANGFEPESRTVTLTANQVADFGLRREAAPRPPGGVLTGTVIDGITDRALSGITIRVDGVGEAVTSGNGAFTFSTAEPAEEVKPATLTSPGTIERRTHLRVPGPVATLPLMPVSADLSAFDQMFRNGGVLRRWTTAPPIVIQTRALRFTGPSDNEFTATASTMSESDVAGLLSDLAWALPQLTGNTFAAFSEVRIETADEGARVPVTRVGSIIVARYEGLAAETTYWGYTRWAWNGSGEMRAATLMLDRAFDASASGFRRSLRAHELGHALGYAHVSMRDSVMNASGRIEPNDFDRNGAKLAFRRPTLNRSPDIDPDPFVSNLRGELEIVWHPGMR